MLQFLSSIWNRIRSFFRRILNYGNHNNSEHENIHSTETDNLNIGKNIHAQLSIREAIKQNNHQEALTLINKASKDEVNAANELGQTSLHLAVATELLGDARSSSIGNIVNALIQKDVDIDAQDKDGETAVHYISRWLLDDGKDRKNKKVKCELWLNGKINDDELMMTLQSLIEGKANVNIESKEGKTALDNITEAKWFGVNESALGVIKTLLEAGAYIKDQKQAFRILKESIRWNETIIFKSSYSIKEDDILKMVNFVISNGITSIGENGTEVKDEIDINYRDEERSNHCLLRAH